MTLDLVGYSDFICPYCYVGGTMMEEVLAEYDATLEWRGFEIHPEIPADGVPIERLDPRMLQGLKSTVGTISARHNIPMQLPSRLPNSRRALLGAEFARTAGKALAYHHAVFQAYFIEDRDIGSLEELQTIADGVGVDAEAFGQALRARAGEDVLDRNRLECGRMGINGVPTWIIGGRYTMVGAQPPHHLRAALDSALAHLQGDSPDA